MTEAPISPLRRRMIEDLTIRKFAPRTQEGFHRIRHYGLFANGGRAENIARARQLLNVPAPQNEPVVITAPATLSRRPSRILVLAAAAG
jgi:hypothetical protein